MRFNATATLIKVSTTRDKYGATHEEAEKRDVFCNRYTVSANDSIQAQSQGLQARASIQLRAIDYEGESRVEFDGKEYEVSSTVGSGELIRITLARKLRNVKKEQSV